MKRKGLFSVFVLIVVNIFQFTIDSIGPIQSWLTLPAQILMVTTANGLLQTAARW